MANEIWAYVIVGVFALILIGFFISWIITKMKGKIEIQLEKYQFSAGEAIKGKVILKLKKPVEAKSLKVGIFGSQDQKSGITVGQSSKQVSSQTVYEFSIPIKGEGSFPPGDNSYNFSFKVPENAFTKSSLPAGAEQVINTGLKVLSALGKANISITKWYVYAELDVSGMNLKKQVQIQIG